MARNKSSRQQNTGRVGIILTRKKKKGSSIKYIEIGGKKVLKPQWRDKTGKELDISNKSNKVRR